MSRLLRRFIYSARHSGLSVWVRVNPFQWRVSAYFYTEEMEDLLHTGAAFGPFSVNLNLSRGASPGYN